MRRIPTGWLLVLGLGLGGSVGAWAQTKDAGKAHLAQCQQKADQLLAGGLKWNDPLSPKQGYLEEEPLKVLWAQAYVACLQEQPLQGGTKK